MINENILTLYLVLNTIIININIIYLNSIIFIISHKHIMRNSKIYKSSHLQRNFSQNFIFLKLEIKIVIFAFTILILLKHILAFSLRKRLVFLGDRNGNVILGF